MDQRLIETKALEVRDFLFTKPFDAPATKAVEPFMPDLKVKFDPKTGATTPDESNLINLDELIQTYKDQCGMELAKKMLANGLATQADFADDGKHSGNVPSNLETAQGRANAAVKAGATTDALAKALGVNASMTEEQLAAIIGKVIQEKYPEIIKTEVKNDGE